LFTYSYKLYIYSITPTTRLIIVDVYSLYSVGAHAFVAVYTMKPANIMFISFISQKKLKPLSYMFVADHFFGFQVASESHTETNYYPVKSTQKTYFSIKMASQRHSKSSVLVSLEKNDKLLYVA